LRAGDVLLVDFGVPAGSEPGFTRPAVVVTADVVLRGRPRTVHLVPLTTNVRRRLPTELPVAGEELDQPSMAQCHLCTVVSVERVVETPDLGNVGSVALAQVRSIIADLLDL
jgi:mRNA interferase MazF